MHNLNSQKHEKRSSVYAWSKHMIKADWKKAEKKTEGYATIVVGAKL